MEALAHTVTITLPDGSTRKVAAGASLREVAEGIGPRLAKDAARREDRRETGRSRDAAPARRGRRDRHGQVSRGAVALPPLDRPPDGQRRQAPVSHGPDRHRSRDRERLLLRLQPGASVHARGPRRDRGGDAPDRRRGQRDRALRDVEGRGDPALRRPEGSAEGRDHPGHSRRERVPLRAEGFHRPLPRPARPLDRQARGLQADPHGGRLLEGRREEPDAPADLRRLLPDAEGARRAPQAARRGEGPGPPEARQGARPRRLPPVGARIALLSAEGGRPLQRPDRAPARRVPQARVRGDHHAADLRRRALQDVGPLRQLPREHVLHEGRRARLRRQAHELPGPLPAVQDAPLVLPRPARALRRLRPPPPVRALGRDGRPDAGPHLLSGRRPRLHALREDGAGDLRVPGVPGLRLRGLRLHRRRDLAGAAPREAHRHRRAVDPGRGGPRRLDEEDRSAVSASRPATGRSTAPRSTSASRTPSAAPGSSARSSATSRSPRTSI